MPRRSKFAISDGKVTKKNQKKAFGENINTILGTNTILAYHLDLLEVLLAVFPHKRATTAASVSHKKKSHP